jgi:hypothetical protein
MRETGDLCGFLSPREHLTQQRIVRVALLHASHILARSKQGECLVTWSGSVGPSIGQA